MDLSELCTGCRTYRRFTQEPVPRPVVERMLETARTASSAANAQPVRATAVLDPQLVAQMQPLVRWAAALPPELGYPKPGEQPTAFIALSLTDGAGDFALVDLGISVRTMQLAAWEAGAGSCIMGAISRGKISALLDIPADQRLRLVMALGYPSHTSTVVDVPEGGDLSYYLDGDRNYYVPKRPFSEFARIL